MNRLLAFSRSSRATLRVLTIAFAAAAGCSDTTLEPEPAPGVPDRLEIVYGTDTAALAAPVQVDSAWTNVGKLFIAVSYPRNCDTHSFRTLAPPTFVEEATPVLPIYLVREVTGRSCAAHHTTLLSIDVRESEALYRYHHSGALQSYIFRVIAPADSASISTLDVPYAPTGSSETVEDTEAARAAIHLSGELTPPEELRLSISHDLRAIRSRYQSEIPELQEISLAAPMRTDAIYLTVDAPTAQAIATGSYRAWDALNAEFRLVSIDPYSAGDYRILMLRFWKNWHAGRVASRYRSLAGVTSAESIPSNGLFTEPRYEVAVRLDPDQRRYLFTKAFGDCPSGCIENHWWYFTLDATGPNQLGSWGIVDSEFLPSWWHDARRTIEAWRGTPFEPWDEATQVSLGGESPTWSPDGTRIAYAVNSRPNSTIWSVAVDGSDRRSIVSLPSWIEDLEWSPDGTRFVYSTQNDIWIVANEGGTPIQLTTDPAADRQPTWSPDGTTIAFSSSRSGSADIWRIPAVGGTATRVFGHPQLAEDQPAWAPDGKRLAYRVWVGPNGQATIWSVALDGSDSRQITFETSNGGSPDARPNWSPDGRSIAFASYRPTAGIWLVPSTGGTRPQRLTFPGGDAPAWSPSGDYLAFVASRYGVGSVWVLDLRSSAMSLRQLN